MTAPDTNLATQKRRHRGPLIGIAVGVLFVVALIIYWGFEDVATPDDPRSAAEVQSEAVEENQTGSLRSAQPGVEPDAATGPPQTSPGTNAPAALE